MFAATATSGSSRYRRPRRPCRRPGSYLPPDYPVEPFSAGPPVTPVLNITFGKLGNTFPKFRFRNDNRVQCKVERQIGLPRDRNELLRTAHPSSLKAVPYYLDRVASLRSGVPGLLARPHRNQSPLNRYAHNLAGTASCRGNTVNDRISAGRLPAFYLHFARAASGRIQPGSRYPSSVQDFCF